MSLYDKKDVELFGQHIDSIMEIIERKKLEMFEPTKAERDKVMSIILSFIKETKRKIYGGYAMNAMIAHKSPADAFYKDYQTPDIDFYSPDPIVDLMKLCNKLHDAGLEPVTGKEGQHKETYSIYVNYQLYCDISYVPRNIYNKMPFLEINGYNYIHPTFMSIDYLRMLTDPLVSYWRIEKGFKRFALLQKFYQLPHVETELEQRKLNTNTSFIFDNIFDFLKNKNTCIIVGLYAYNYFLEQSNILSDNTKNSKKFKYINIDYYEIISSEYKDDAVALIEYLKLKHPGSKVTHVENYPFFQFLGYNVDIFVDNILVATIYHNNNKCYPYQKIKAVKLENNNLVPSKDFIYIGTYAMVLMFALCRMMKAKTDGEEKLRNHYTILISHLVEMRSYYFKTTKKNIFDNTAFREFITDCIGETIMPEREARLRMKYRKEQKKPFAFTYDPSSEKKEPASNYVFNNSSGNAIKNKKNMKLYNNKVKLDIIKENSEEDDDNDADIK